MPVRAVLLLLSKVTQKHFRQPYRPSKVPLRPARSFSSLRSVCLCPIISLPEYISGHHDTVCPPDTSSAQHPFSSGSVPICHPAKSAGIPHNAIRYQSISPITRCRIFRYYCCNQVFSAPRYTFSFSWYAPAGESPYLHNTSSKNPQTSYQSPLFA